MNFPLHSLIRMPFLKGLSLFRINFLVLLSRFLSKTTKMSELFCFLNCLPDAYMASLVCSRILLLVKLLLNVLFIVYKSQEAWQQ